MVLLCCNGQDVKALTEGVIECAMSIEELSLPNHNFGDNGARHVVRLLQVESTPHASYMLGPHV
jgi:hypothetical protein